MEQQLNMENETEIVNAPDIFRMDTIKKFHETVQKLLDKNKAKIIIDFKNTDFIDSFGIGTLVSLTKVAKARNSVIILRNLNKDIRNFFAETDLDKIFYLDTASGVREPLVDLFEEAVDIKLEIAIEEEEDVCIMLLKGVMNYPFSSKYFQRQFLISMAKYKKILLDFSELTFIDSMCISIFTTMNKLFAKAGGSLKACSINFIIEDLFKSLNFDQVIPIFKSRKLALQSWKE